MISRALPVGIKGDIHIYIRHFMILILDTARQSEQVLFVAFTPEYIIASKLLYFWSSCILNALVAVFVFQTVILFLSLDSIQRLVEITDPYFPVGPTMPERSRGRGQTNTVRLIL